MQINSESGPAVGYIIDLGTYAFWITVVGTIGTLNVDREGEAIVRAKERKRRKREYPMVINDHCPTGISMSDLVGRGLCFMKLSAQAIAVAVLVYRFGKD